MGRGQRSAEAVASTEFILRVLQLQFARNTVWENKVPADQKFVPSDHLFSKFGLPDPFEAQEFATYVRSSGGYQVGTFAFYRKQSASQGSHDLTDAELGG